jgi:hypothetical protein
MKHCLTLLLLCSLATGGCSHFSQASRQQRAYEKYVRKSSRVRAQQRAFFKQRQQQAPPAQIPTDPVENVATGPEAMPSES